MPASQEEKSEENEEEDEETPLVEFEFEGKTYYRDEENLVYTLTEDGELDDTPVGRYLPKSEKVKYFPTKA